MITTEHSTEPAVWLQDYEYPFSVRTAEVAGQVLGYVDEGEGQTYLLIQAGQWSHVYRDVISRLARRGRVIAVDFPGAGLSPEPDSEPTLGDLADVLEGFVEQLGLSDIVLVMHDVSGIAGSAFAVRHPELVSGIVYANTFGWDPDRFSLRLMLRVVSSAPSRGLAWLTNWMLRLSASSFGAGRYWDPAAKRLFRAAGSPRRRRARSLRLFRQALGHPPIFAEIEAGRHKLRTTPALTIFGERNDLYGFVERHVGHHDDIESVVVRKGNHFPMGDDPDLFASSVVGWWDGKR